MLHTTPGCMVEFSQGSGANRSKTCCNPLVIWQIQSAKVVLMLCQMTQESRNTFKWAVTSHNCRLDTSSCHAVGVGWLRGGTHPSCSCQADPASLLPALKMWHSKKNWNWNINTFSGTFASIPTKSRGGWRHRCWSCWCWSCWCWSWPNNYKLCTGLRLDKNDLVNLSQRKLSQIELDPVGNWARGKLSQREVEPVGSWASGKLSQREVEPEGSWASGKLSQWELEPEGSWARWNMSQREVEPTGKKSFVGFFF